MRRCIQLAGAAGAAGEVPVGAIVARDGVILEEGQNRCVERRSPIAHA